MMTALVAIVVLVTTLVPVVSFRTASLKRTSLSPAVTYVPMASSTTTPTPTPEGILGTIQGVAKVFSGAAQYIVKQPVRIQYATAMSTRFAFFLLQNVGVSYLFSSKKVTDEKEESKRTPIDPVLVIRAVVDAILSEGGESSVGMFADKISAEINPSSSSSSDPSTTERTRLSPDEQVEFFKKNFVSIIGVLKDDLNNIEQGIYKFPYDLDPTKTPSQWSPISVLKQFTDYASDRQKVIERSDRRDGLEIQRNFKSSKYPDYYLQNYHYQTDGWLSAKSAELYDYQVESLFLGTADSMRRGILPSINAFMSDRDPADTKLLDLATGTGRFISFVMDNYRDLDVTVMDLSPFYLAEAKKTLRHFESSVTFVEGAGEEMPFEDSSFDAITCVYMFHELPMEVRVKVVKEMCRVLKPGGKLFFVDSAQKNEVPYEGVLKGFTIIAHEPYYLNYTEMDLDALFESNGFSVENKAVNWVSKCVTALKK